MKNLLYTTFILLFISCESKQEENKAIEYPFKASYSSDISMGDPSLSNIVLDLQKAANEGDFEKTMSESSATENKLGDDFLSVSGQGAAVARKTGTTDKERLTALYGDISGATAFSEKHIKTKDEIVAASDAFFPFVDGIEKLVQSGVTAVIQPSGSIRDKEIIKFANETNTILVFSKTRHFRH